MRTVASAIAALCLLSSTPCLAQARPATTSWKVTGNIAGRAIALQCKFTNRGGKLGGACVEVAGTGGTIGEVHPLTGGSVNGDRVGWTYNTTAMTMTFEVTYAGTISGNRMTGTVSASIRSGNFTAIKI